MKEYRINENLIEYLLSKGVIISNKEDALKKIERYTYYSIINTYKSVFKNEDGNLFAMYRLMKYMLYLILIKN